MFDRFGVIKQICFYFTIIYCPCQKHLPLTDVIISPYSFLEYQGIMQTYNVSEITYITSNITSGFRVPKYQNTNRFN